MKFGRWTSERMQYNFIARVEQGGRWNFSNLSSFLTNNCQAFRGRHPIHSFTA